MTDNRQSNDTQFERLISSIESLRMHLGELPEQLAGRLRGEIEAVGLSAGRGAQEGGIYFPPTPRAASAPLFHAEPDHQDQQQQPVMDEDNGSNAGSTLVDHLEAQAQADAEQAAQGTTRGGVRFGINPLSSFAQLDKRMADSADVDGKVGRKGSIGKKGMRGPRMPGMAGLKMWGALISLVLPCSRRMLTLRCRWSHARIFRRARRTLGRRCSCSDRRQRQGGDRQSAQERRRVEEAQAWSRCRSDQDG